MTKNEKTEKVTNELIYEVLKTLQSGQNKLYDRVLNIESEIRSLRKQVHSLEGDSIRRDEIMAELGVHVDRINTRLDLRDS